MPVFDRYGISIRTGDEVYNHRETRHPDKVWRVTAVDDDGRVVMESDYVCRDAHYPPCNNTKSLYRAAALQVIGVGG